MAITAAFEQSAITLVVGTELSLTNNSAVIAAQATAGVFQLFVDLANMAAGDEFVVTLYEKATAVATQRSAHGFLVTGGPLTSPLFISPSMILMRGWDWTLKQVAGTGRAVSWSIRQVA